MTRIIENFLKVTWSIARLSDVMLKNVGKIGRCQTIKNSTAWSAFVISAYICHLNITNLQITATYLEAQRTNSSALE